MVITHSMALPRTPGTLPPATFAAASPAPANGTLTQSIRLDFRRTGRRSLLSFLLLTATIPETSDSQKALLKEYLQRSRENKEKNDKERLDDYYKRNYKDYFELIQGSADGKKDEELTESEKGIRDWLQKNRK